MNPMRLAPVIDSVMDARYRMMSRDPRNMRRSFTSRRSRRSRTICDAGPRFRDSGPRWDPEGAGSRLQLLEDGQPRQRQRAEGDDGHEVHEEGAREVPPDDLRVVADPHAALALGQMHVEEEL